MNKTLDNIGWIDRPALLGGTPHITREWPPFNSIGADEQREVLDVLESGVLSAFHASPGEPFLGGPKVRSLEQAWTSRFKVKHAVSMNSATSALFAAVAACKVGPGDEVITHPYAAPSAVSAILGNGAIPIFADIDPHTQNLDPESVAQRITPLTKAILTVHVAGLPTHMKPLQEMASRQKLRVIEDTAQSAAATCHGKLAGTVGDIGVFSLNSRKIIQSGEGGIAVTNDDDLALRLQLIRNHGEQLIPTLETEHDLNLIGFNFRMTELEAAVAVRQLEKLDELNGWNIRLANHLTRRIEQEFDCLAPPQVPDGFTHVYYNYPLRFDADTAGMSLDLFAEAVQAEGVPLNAKQVNMLYRLPLFQRRSAQGDSGYPFGKAWYRGDAKYQDGICPQAEALAQRLMTLDTVIRKPNSIDDMDRVIESFAKVLLFKEELVAWDADGRPDPKPFLKKTVSKPAPSKSKPSPVDSPQLDSVSPLSIEKIPVELNESELMGPEEDENQPDAESTVRIAMGTQSTDGASALAPVAEVLLERPDVELHIAVAGSAIPIFRQRFRTDLREMMPGTNVYKPYDEHVDAWLGELQPDIVLTALTGSHTWLDYALQRAAKERGIKTTAVLDAWTDYSGRLQNEDGEPFQYLPAKYGMPDFTTALEHAELGVPKANLQLVGHPLHTDLKRFIPRWREMRERIRGWIEVGRDVDVIVFISEPLTQAVESGAIPSPGYDEFDALNTVAVALAQIYRKRKCILAVTEYRHERTFGDRLHGGELGGVRVVDVTDSEPSTLDWILGADVVVGMSSPLLVHSACAGIHTLVVQPNLLREHDRNPLTRRGLLPNLETTNDVIDELKRHSDPDKRRLAAIRKEFRWNQDAAKKAAAMVVEHGKPEDG
ncbi:DegT/DnrJ/EryC1/StrS family aminotransferase [bacterium]|nr:DegT/DnrJ/EryC1/StrS family aminotransferase [bacterium]